MVVGISGTNLTLSRPRRHVSGVLEVVVVMTSSSSRSMVIGSVVDTINRLVILRSIEQLTTHLGNQQHLFIFVEVG